MQLYGAPVWELQKAWLQFRICAKCIVYVTFLHIWYSVSLVYDLAKVRPSSFFTLGLEVYSNNPALNTMKRGGRNSYKVLVEHTLKFVEPLEYHVWQ
jgi:hypothetical protein